eukprot:scaffold10232_cov75-Phaeocystis_antarctica.AAC.4
MRLLVRDGLRLFARLIPAEERAVRPPPRPALASLHQRTAHVVARRNRQAPCRDCVEPLHRQRQPRYLPGSPPHAITFAPCSSRPTATVCAPPAAMLARGGRTTSSTNLSKRLAGSPLRAKGSGQPSCVARAAAAAATALHRAWQEPAAATSDSEGTSASTSVRASLGSEMSVTAVVVGCGSSGRGVRAIRALSSALASAPLVDVTRWQGG